MAELKENPRKVSLWQLLSMSTGYTSKYCQMVINNQRNQNAKGAKVIVEKYNELQKLLGNGE
jgi:hypothetical protein